MNRSLLMKLIWQGIGEPTDLDPDTDTQYNDGPLLAFIANEAQRRIAMWKDPVKGHRLRLQSLFGDMYFQSTYFDEDLDDDAASTTSITLPSTDVLGGSSTYDDVYNGWVLEISSEAKIIIDYDGTSYTATVHEAYGSAPVATDGYKLYKNFYYLLPSTHAWVGEHISKPATTDKYKATGNLIEILKVVDLNNEREVGKARGSYYPTNSLDSPGDPAQWWRFGNKLIFDRPQDETLSFYTEYYRLPLDMAGSDSEPEIPEMFHWGIVLWGINWGFARQQDFSAKWSGGQDFLAFMRSTKSEYDIMSERGELYGSLQKD